MLQVKLEGFVIEPDSEKVVDDGKGWAVWRALKLIDKSNDADIAEWFYVAACNQYFYEKVALKDNQGKGYYSQDQFDEDELLESVQQDFQKLSFEDWDDFYVKMNKVFKYEDEDRLQEPEDSE